MNIRNITAASAVALALGIALPVSAVSINGILQGSNDTEARACTMEAKQCPDGSYVGRTGPNCEFAACPGASNGNGTGSSNGDATVNGSVNVDVSGEADVSSDTGSNNGFGAELSTMIKGFLGIGSNGEGNSDTDANSSASVNGSVSGNANSSNNGSNASGNGGLDIEALIMTRADVDNGNVDATSRDWATVSSDADLSGYIAAQMEGDENIAEVQTSPSNVAVTYAQHARLLGFIPTTLHATAMVDASGDVSVDYPWYSFLYATEADIEASLQERINAVFSASATATAAGDVDSDGTANATGSASADAEADVNAAADATAQLTAEAQARLVAEIRAVLEQEFNAQVQADATANAGANAQ